MKELKNIVKVLMIILIGIMLTVSTAKITYASSDDLLFTSSEGNELDGEDEDEDDEEEEDDDEYLSITSSDLNSNTNNSTGNTNRNLNNTVSNTNNSANISNRSVSNTNALAKTGLSDSGSMIAIILVVCGISAVYSIRKMNDYKKL